MQEQNLDQHTHGDACLVWLAGMEVQCSRCQNTPRTYGLYPPECPDCQGTGTVARFPMLREACICFRCGYTKLHEDCNGLGWVAVEHDRVERVLAAIWTLGNVRRVEFWQALNGRIWCDIYPQKEFDDKGTRIVHQGCANNAGQAAATALCRLIEVHDV